MRLMLLTVVVVAACDTDATTTDPNMTCFNNGDTPTERCWTKPLEAWCGGDDTPELEVGARFVPTKPEGAVPEPCLVCADVDGVLQWTPTECVLVCTSDTLDVRIYIANAFGINCAICREHAPGEFHYDLCPNFSEAGLEPPE